MTAPSLRNPLDLPEIRAQVSQFLAKGDALSCALVCRAWSGSFLEMIWREIDFNSIPVRRMFDAMGHRVLSRYIHLIRDAKNMGDPCQLELFIQSKIDQLQGLGIVFTVNTSFQNKSFELIRQHRGSLVQLDLSMSIDSERLHLALDAITLPLTLHPEGGKEAFSRLSNLQLQGLCITRKAFSTLLHGCPALEKLDMRETAVSIGQDPSSDMYKHCGVKQLIASFIQVFNLDPKAPDAPSLLAYFPNLETWSTWNISWTFDVHPERIKRELRPCPSLKCILTNVTQGPIVKHLLVQVFEGLRTIEIVYKSISDEVIMAILGHRNTLEGVLSHIPHENFYFAEEVPPVNDHFRNSDWIVQLLPRMCSKLKEFAYPLHSMDMDIVEMSTWSCKGLEKLRVRVHGLDSKEEIDLAIQMWVDGCALRRQLLREREWERELGVIGEADVHVDPVAIGPPLSDKSVEARVARHLLKFEKLKSVWLGTRLRHI